MQPLCLPQGHSVQAQASQANSRAAPDFAKKREFFFAVQSF